MLIKRVYQADPLLCPNCGGTMKIIAFIEARQHEVLRKILEHCGLWQQPLSRGPPGSTRSAHAGRQAGGDPPDIGDDLLAFALGHLFRQQADGDAGDRHIA